MRQFHVVVVEGYVKLPEQTLPNIGGVVSSASGLAKLLRHMRNRAALATLAELVGNEFHAHICN